MTTRSDIARLMSSKAVAGAATATLLAGGGALVTLNASVPSIGGSGDDGKLVRATSRPDDTRRDDAGRPGGDADLDLPGFQRAAPAAAASSLTKRPDDLPASAIDHRLDTSAVDRAGGVSERVHEALSGGDLAPGDEGFGHAVAERARAGGADLGAQVSAAARGDADHAAADAPTGSPSDGPAPDDVVAPPAPAGPPAHARPATADKADKADKAGRGAGKPSSDPGSRP